MAHSRSALKRWRQNEKRRARNKPVLTATRSSVKRARTAIEEGSDTADAIIREAQSILDKAAKRRIIHPNVVSRQKGKMQKALNAAGAATPGEAPKKARAAKKTAKKAPAKKAAAKRTAKKTS